MLAGTGKAGKMTWRGVSESKEAKDGEEGSGLFFGSSWLGDGVAWMILNPGTFGLPVKVRLGVEK
jgi:hypothetical protein